MPDPTATKEDLAALVRQLVDRPEEVSVVAVPMRRATVFEVRTASEDMGKVIGRHGRTARALRALLDSRGEVDGTQYGLEILDS